MNPFLQRWFGLGAAPTAEASGSCAARGGLKTYSEPDPSTPDQPYSWAVECNDGTRCTGGAERNTECGIDLGKWGGSGVNLNNWGGGVNLHNWGSVGPETKQVLNPYRAYLQGAWDALRGTLAYEIPGRGPLIEEARRKLVAAKWYLLGKYPGTDVKHIDENLIAAEYLAGIAAAGVDPVPSYPQSLLNYNSHLGFLLDSLQRKIDGAVKYIDAPASSSSGASSGGTSNGVPATAAFPQAGQQTAVGPGYYQVEPGAEGGGGGSLPYASPPGSYDITGSGGKPGPGTAVPPVPAAAAPTKSSKWPYVVGGVVLLTAGAVALSFVSKRK